MTLPEFANGSFFFSLFALWVSIFSLYYRIRTDRKLREFKEAVALWNRENAHLFDKAKRGSFRDARGIFTWQEGDEPAEVSIRRIRGD
jgi:hypothetical protein